MIYIVIGAQFGSEGKGEIVAYLARRLQDEGSLGAVVRVGGPNAGHTLTLDGTPYPMRSIPAAWHTDAHLFIGQGSVVDLDVLVEDTRLVENGTASIHGPEAGGEHPLDRTFIDNQAVILNNHDIYTEREWAEEGLTERASTFKGIGAARAKHVARFKDAKLYGDLDPEQQPFPGVDSSVILNTLVAMGKDIIIETTQGFGLSLSASNNYPDVTSTDITPGKALSDAGLSSRLPHRVIGVVRTHPIRIAGASGELTGETDFAEISHNLGRDIKVEKTTVTQKVRRIGTFDKQQFARFVKVCQPDILALTFADYLEGVEPDTHINGHNSGPIEEWLTDNGVAVDPTRFVSTGPGHITDTWNADIAPGSKRPGTW